MLTEILGWLEQTAISSAIRQSDWAVMALEAIHLLGLALLGGAAVIASLRRTGLPLRTLVSELRPLALIGLALMVGTGTLIALSMPFKYCNNTAFQWKMALLAVALIVSILLARRPSRVLALLSLVLWLSVGFGGRLIGFL